MLNVISRNGRHTITAQTYAVPCEDTELALEAITRLVLPDLPFGTHYTDKVVGTGSSPITGEPETYIRVVGDERAHSAMLGYFEWTGH